MRGGILRDERDAWKALWHAESTVEEAGGRLAASWCCRAAEAENSGSAVAVPGQGDMLSPCQTS